MGSNLHYSVSESSSHTTLLPIVNCFSTVNFWILAIDQALHAPNLALAQLYVKDSRGISVGFWDDVPLFQGKRRWPMIFFYLNLRLGISNIPDYIILVAHSIF